MNSEPTPVDMSIETNEESILHLPQSKLIAFYVVTTLICLGLVFYVGPTEWSLLRRVAAGLIGGAWCFICLVINRVLVA